ncbi:MAG: metallopeptidase TldD-related protein, partial [Gammaproteobacteria bacterium]|nr:metallopeptidase TldD-related protein [Gammaproteobacteria bacterium]
MNSEKLKVKKARGLLTGEVNRRNFMLRALGSVSALFLAGCDKLSRTEGFVRMLESAEQLTYRVQRLVTARNAMAKEFSAADLSPVFRSNGTDNPDSPEYQALAADEFINWRLEVTGLVEHPGSFSLAELHSLPARTQITRHDCVEGWSAIGKWKGVRLGTVLERVKPLPNARYVMFYCSDVRPLVRLNVSVIAEQDGRREQGSAGGGGRVSYQYFLDSERGLGYAREAVRQALVNLEAVAAPAGAMQVVLGPGWPGVLLHEAIGHGLEGDFNRKGSSAFAGRIGERVASEQCTVVDDGTLENRRGSLNLDDEGTPTQCTTLIENGILKGYIHDKLNARLMGVKPTGNGRRESYAHLPMPRMTNTYMRAGDYSPDEIIRSVDKGLYAVNFGGGQVDITSGKFVFSASEAYLIENGRITRPVKGA